MCVYVMPLECVCVCLIRSREYEQYSIQFKEHYMFGFAGSVCDISVNIMYYIIAAVYANSVSLLLMHHVLLSKQIYSLRVALGELWV